MSDDGEPQTVRYEGLLVTTWREQSGRWRLHVESVDMEEEGAFEKEALLADGSDRLDAFARATKWIDRHLKNHLQ